MSRSPLWTAYPCSPVRRPVLSYCSQSHRPGQLQKFELVVCMCGLGWGWVVVGCVRTNACQVLHGCSMCTRLSLALSRSTHVFRSIQSLVNAGLCYCCAFVRPVGWGYAGVWTLQTHGWEDSMCQTHAPATALPATNASCGTAPRSNARVRVVRWGAFCTQRDAVGRSAGELRKLLLLPRTRCCICADTAPVQILMEIVLIKSGEMGK